MGNELPLNDYGYDIFIEIIDKDSFETEQSIILNNAEAIKFKAIGTNTKKEITGTAEISDDGYKYLIQKDDLTTKDVYSCELIFEFENRQITAKLGNLKVI